MIRALSLLFVLALLGCGDERDAPAPRDEQADVAALQGALTEDPAQLVLDEVDDAVARQRPVIAADLLEDAAIPAVNRHIESLQALQMGTSRGQTLRTRAIRLLRARRTALQHWQTALARGIGHDDEVLLDALHETGEAEHDIAAFLAELADIRPLETGGAGASPDHDRGALEGLPPLAPPTSGEGDDTTTEPDEPDPHGADPVDGIEDLTEPPAPTPLRGPGEPALRDDLEDHHAAPPPR